MEKSNETERMYKELYDISLKVYDEENKRYEYMELKAFRFLSALTFIFVFFTYFFGSIFIKDLKYLNQSISENEFIFLCIIILNILCLISLVINWFIFLNVMTSYRLKGLPKEELIEFYKEHENIDVYNTMAKGIMNAVDENKKKTNKKSDRLDCGIKMLKFNGYFIILLLIISFIYNIFN